MKDAVSFKIGDRVQVFNASNKLVGKTGVINFFLPGEQINLIERQIIKNLVAVKMGDNGELEQFFFEELTKL